ncbi:MAG: aldo/keto reductase [Chloroflexota bacterium]
MRYEELHGCKVPNVGFGTWSIGGGTRADRNRDAASLAALRSAIELGYAHFDTAETYAAGHCEELLRRAIRESRTDRGGLFLTSNVQPAYLNAENVLRACEGSLRRLGTEYLDLHLIHWPNQEIDLVESFRGLNGLVKSGMAGNWVSAISVSTCSNKRGGCPRRRSSLIRFR